MSFKKNICFFSFACALLMLFGSVFSAFGAEEPVGNLWDFSHKDSSGGVAIYTPSEVLALLGAEEISEAEAAYLDTYHAGLLLLEDGISNDKITVSCESGAVSVRALPYTYEAKNGALVTWYPVSATLSSLPEQTLILSASGEGRWENASGEGVPMVAVTYRCQIVLPRADANELLEMAYRDAVAAEKMAQEQAEQFAAYEEAYLAYRAYLEALEQYEIDLARYEQYLTDMSAYELLLEKYRRYLSDMEAYHKASEAYAAYEQAMVQYGKDKTAYDKAYAAYQVEAEKYRAYFAKLNGVRERMYAIESLFVRPSNGVNALYDALQNKELISAFETNRNDMVRLGADAQKLDAMLAASDELNGYLRAYRDARERSEADAFAYYCQYYTQISTLFNDLYEQMTGVMTPKIFRFICAKIQVDYEKDPEMATYKKWRVKNVLAQIYLVSLSLDDSKTAEAVWHFYTDDGVAHTYAFRDLLATNVLLTDNNTSCPDGYSWPQEVEQPIAPTMPTEPTRVSAPLKPQTVEEPTAPHEVKKPTEPKKAEDPGEPPLGTGFLVQTVELLEAYRRGELAPRVTLTEDATLTFERRVEKLVSYENKPVVTVYGNDGKTVLDAYVAERGVALCAPSLSYVPTADLCYDYVFAGWSYSRASYEEMIEAPITSDVCLYAYCAAEPRTYTVTWDTGEETVRQTYTFGQMPQYEGVPTKSSTATTVYSFTEWYPLPAPVRGDVTYTAQYRESERQYTVKWEILGEMQEKSYAYGATPYVPSYPAEYIEGNELVRFVGWERPITAVCEDITYRAIYERRVLASASAAVTVSKQLDGTLTVHTASDSLSLAALLDYAAEKQSRVQLTLGDSTLILDRRTVAVMAQKGFSRLEIVKEWQEGRLCRLRLLWKDGQGGDLVAPEGVRVHLPKTCVKASGLYLYAMYSETTRMELPFELGEELVFSGAEVTDYTFVNRYKITVVADGRGTAVSDPRELEAGELFRLFLYPNSEFCFDNVEIYLQESRVKMMPTDISAIEMADEDITVYVYFKPMRYTVTFMALGEVLTQREYALGAAVHIPEMEESFEKDGYRYTFLGWTPVVMRVAGNTTYAAQYRIVPIGESVDMGERDALESVKVHYIYPAIAAVLAAGAVSLVTVYALQCRKRRRKRRKAQK